MELPMMLPLVALVLFPTLIRNDLDRTIGQDSKIKVFAGVLLTLPELHEELRSKLVRHTQAAELSNRLT
jgi:hypothetical protein